MSIQPTWKDIVERWNSDEIQSLVIQPLEDVTDEHFQPTPHAGEFFSLIFAFAATIYQHAYSSDNLTRALYASCANNMPHTRDADTDQQELFREILEKMPDGFENYSITSGHLNFPGGTDFSVEKASEFLDFIVSNVFSDIMRQIRRDARNQ